MGAEQSITKYTKLQEFLAEAIGTFFLLLLGVGSVAMVVLFPTTINTASVLKGSWIDIAVGWGLGVAFGIFVSVRISGAHINPAVTIALAVTKQFPASKVWYYITAQMLGAFIGALLAFVVFYAKWIQIDPSLANTQSVLATFPAVKGFWPGFIDQIVGTFVLVFLIQVVSNYVKDAATSPAFPFIIGAIVLAIGISLGGMNGYAINPARDLGPRLVLLVAGFKNTGFDSYVFIIPILGPIVGGTLGAFLYKMLLAKSFNSKIN